MLICNHHFLRHKERAMSRIPPLTRAELNDPVGLDMFKRKFGSLDADPANGSISGTPGDWELVIGRVPAVLAHVVQGFALYADQQRALDPLLRELAQARAGYACGCQFVFSQHCKGLRAVGASEEQVAAVPQWQVTDAFTPTQRAVLAYTDALAHEHGRVPDALYARLAEDLPAEAIIELTYIACMYVMFATITRALQLEFDDRPEPVVEVPAPAGFRYGGAAQTLGLA
jgi:AhpD family alkylhydroperoxidase